jgi:(1->4)-alpha-D-glucan 1-alpha-D-glucosylmutase
LQLRPEFGFDDAAGLVDYLVDLGITHVYASPYLQAAAGSTHGYDVVDHSRVNEELGGAAGHERFIGALRDAGLGQVLDIVPNHMAVTTENAWWSDVLENGPSSRYAWYFDVDWDPPEPRLRNTVLLPVLGDHYGRVLEAGELRLERAGGSFVVRYADLVLPVAPRTYDAVLGLAAAESGDDDLAFLAGAFGALPLATAIDRPSVIARHRDKEVLKRQLARLCEERDGVVKAVETALDRVNDDADLLDAMLERQNYRLAFWRTARDDLDYRRFFDITSLAGLRMEDDQVFADTHELVLGWLRQGVLDGVRIDHPDGLRDPAGYLERLRACSPDAWIVVEKILEPGETLPDDWPVDGTTGYDFLARVDQLFVDARGEQPMSDAYAWFTGSSDSFEDVVHRAKHEVIERVLAADVNRLANLFMLVCDQQRRYRDFTRRELEAALVEALACFRVYRTYVRPGEAIRPTDAAHIAEVLEDARRRRGDLDGEVFDLLGAVLRGEVDGPGAALCSRFQQASGPVMAKGVEDTAFYRYNRLVSLNEVGGDPQGFGSSVDAFHEVTLASAARAPHSMLASSTHDTKRSEDVRARIAVLSEVPLEFAAAADRWASMHEPPDRDLAWLLFQTLVGAHPLPLERALAYVEKATKEAKRHTSWTDPDPAYDAAVCQWVEALLGDELFRDDLDAFVRPLVDPGRVNALAAQLIKLTAPGVPDVYQGTELWDLSLVDPDNRRPVDFTHRRRLLADLDRLAPAEVWARRDEGLPKLLVTRDALHLRRRRPEAFRNGSYEVLAVHGAGAEHVVAFARAGEVAVVVPRLPVTLERAGGWRDTTVDLPWKRAVALGELLGEFPVALLER